MIKIIHPRLHKPWKSVRSDDGVLIVDDSISEKPYTDPNGLVCTHYDHSKDCFVNGINFVTLLYRAKGVQFPIGFTLVIKSLQCLIKDRKEVWRSEKTKNEMLRELTKQACQNAVKFTYLLCDSCGAARAVSKCRKYQFHTFIEEAVDRRS